MLYFLSVSYVGTVFHGSQIQGKTPTVQLALNEALSVLLRKPIATFGASRTDEGVHARQNFYHFSWPIPLENDFLYRLNALLPFEISVNKLLLPARQESANARFDALSREYCYRLYKEKSPFLLKRAFFYPYKINQEVLETTAALLLGTHDFTSFSKRKTQSKTFVCTIEKAEWHFSESEFYFEVRANRFLRGMVRALVTTQLQVARNKMSLDFFGGLFEKKDCRLADFSAPGYGLYLEKINYPEGYFLEK